MFFSGALTVTAATIVALGPLLLPPQDRPAATNRKSRRARKAGRK
jgi:predicted small lipoprotein YifL